MKRFANSKLLLAGSIILTSIICGSASAQTSPEPPGAEAPVAIPGATPVSGTARTDKPALIVMAFESGTVVAQVRDKRGLGAILAGMGSGRGGESYDPSQLGVGIADLLIAKLLETGQFRLIERKTTDPPGSAQFILTGSVTKFGLEEHNVGGIVASMATMGLLSYKKHKTEVTLTARVINAATGEIVASMTGSGRSGKGGGIRVLGMGSNGLGGADVSSSNFRSTAIGEATERAVSDMAKKVIEAKPAL